MATSESQVQSIFLKAVAIESSQERAAFLDQTCPSRELRRRVEELLDANSEMGSFMQGQAAAVVPTVDQIAERPGTVIGPYKLLEQIGEGGFGAVYIAAQTKPVERRVALKLIKPGMDTREVIARFEAERQALALMDHSNVAKVFDAGTTESGRPYFVMELVQGVPIIEFCDKNSLNTPRRLEMFIDVCHAVQHAHQKGIIHRDIKPSNIMVAQHSGKPVPKVIDFGVAKATSQKLTEKTLYTAYGQMVGTPTYMSPEQAEMSGLGIDTRSDIYSLGVLLYELLTGATPLDPTRLRTTGYAELQRIIREEVPPLPSQKLSTLGKEAATAAKCRRTDPAKLTQLLRGELDWIVMKAREKERDRRYESASSFAADVDRFLNDEAVEACPPSRVYRLRKFARRNRGSVVALASLLLMLCLGLAGTSLGLYRARVAENNATRDRDKALAAREAEAEALANAVEAQAAERRLTFNMAFDRGLVLCDQGHIGRGMLWLARALELAPLEETEMRRVILANLNAWRRELHTLEAIFPHNQRASNGAFSPNGKLVVTGSEDDTAQVWDATTFTRRGPPLLHDGDIHEVIFSPDGSSILTANYDKTARLWDTNTGQLIHRLRRPDLVPAAAFSPDGSWFVTGSGDGAVTIWDTHTGQPIGKPLGHGFMVHDVAVSCDGLQLLTACHDKNARLWDLSTRELIATFKHDAIVQTADFRRPDCNQIVTGDSDGNVYLWGVLAATADDDQTLKTATEEFISGPWPHKGNVHRLRSGPDGSQILTACFDNTARLWDPDTGTQIGAAFEHQGGIHGVAFSPDSSLILTACEDNTVRLWRPADGQSVQIVRHEGLGDNEPVYTSDGFYILTIDDEDTAVVRDVRTGTAISAPFRQQGIRGVAVSPDRSKILTGGGSARLWDAATGEPLGAPFHEGDVIWVVAFDPDGTRMLTGAFNGNVQLRRVDTGAPTGDALELGARVFGVAFSPDGSRIVLTSSDKVARLFDANMGNIPRPLLGHQGSVFAVAFSPDGTRIVTGSFDNTARVWDTTTGEPVSNPMPHQGAVWRAVAFSPDGQTVVTGCDDRTVRIWDVASAKPIGPWLRHEDGIRMVAFSNDGWQIRTGTTVGTVRFWDVTVSPMEDDVARINLWLQTVSGMELDSEGNLNVLDAQSWHQRRRQLRELGGPPR